MGNTKAGLFIYPAENPPRLVAIGKYVPAYIAVSYTHLTLPTKA